MFRLNTTVALAIFSLIGIAAATTVVHAADAEDVRQRVPSPPQLQAPQETPVPADGMPAPSAEDTLGEDGSFVLTGVSIEGATRFDADDFAPLYAPFLANTVTVDDITKMADKITAHYRRHGYFLSRAIVPAQETDFGFIRIQIIEGAIDEIEIHGDKPADFDTWVAPVTKQRPLQIGTLERVMLLINDLPGITVTKSEIQPDPDDYSHHKLVLTIDKDRYDGSLYLDNRGTSDAGVLQLNSATSFNSTIKTGDRITLGVFTIPDDPAELAVGSLSYALPLGNDGVTLTTSGSVSRKGINADTLAGDSEKETERLSVGLSYPFKRSRAQSLWGRLSLEKTHARQEQAGVLSYEDDTTVLETGLNFMDVRMGGTTSLGAAVVFGLDLFDASEAGSGNLSRTDADGTFTKLKLNASRAQSLPWNFSLLAAATAQLSDNPLLLGQEFSLGGASFGRGYDYDELTGEDALATFVELRYGRSVETTYLKAYQLYGFYDWGSVWSQNAAPGTRQSTLSSAGGGIRLGLPMNLHLSYEVAKPLNRIPVQETDKDWRHFFSLSLTY